MLDIINLIANNGIGIVCVAYLIYFQSTTMKEMLKTLSTINIRLAMIEGKVGIDNSEYMKEVKKNEIK